MYKRLGNESKAFLLWLRGYKVNTYPADAVTAGKHVSALKTIWR